MRDKSHLGIDVSTKTGVPKIIKEGLKIKASDETAIIFYDGELYTLGFKNYTGRFEPIRA